MYKVRCDQGHEFNYPITDKWPRCKYSHNGFEFLDKNDIWRPFLKAPGHCMFCNVQIDRPYAETWHEVMKRIENQKYTCSQHKDFEELILSGREFLK